MTALLEFNNVALDKGSTLSFSVRSGEMLVLQTSTQEAKAFVIDLALGNAVPENGKVLLQGKSLAESRAGSIGWIPAKGGMLSNLKAWENITLSLWFHSKREPILTEEKISGLLRELKMDQLEWGRFMSSPAARLSPLERKLVGLIRGLVLAPSLLLIDAGLFEEVEASQSRDWITLLEKYVQDVEGRALLVVASTAITLPWKLIE